MNINYRSDYSTPDSFEQSYIQYQRELDRAKGRLSLVEFQDNEEEKKRLLKKINKLRVQVTIAKRILDESSRQQIAKPKRL